MASKSAVIVTRDEISTALEQTLPDGVTRIDAPTYPSRRAVQDVLETIEALGPHHLWLDVRPELSLLWVRQLATFRLPVILAAPPAASKAEVDEMVALASRGEFPLLVANELAFSKGMLTLAAMRSKGTLGKCERARIALTIPDGKILEHALVDTAVHYRVVSMVSDALVLLSLLGMETADLQLVSPMGSTYLDSLKCRIVGTDGERAIMSIVPGSGHRMTGKLSLSMGDSTVSWLLGSSSETLGVRTVASEKKRVSRRTSMAAVISELEGSLFGSEASGYSRLADYGSSLDKALALVDDYLYGDAKALSACKASDFKERIARGGDVYAELDLAVQKNVRSGFFLSKERYRSFVTPVSRPLSILLVRVPSNPQRCGEAVYPPLGIAQISAVAIEMGCRSLLCDLAVGGGAGQRLTGGDEDFEILAARLRETVRRGDYDLVGLSADVTVDIALVRHLAAAVKDEGIRWTMFGGRLVRNTINSMSGIDQGPIDYIAFGEGEIALAGLIRHLVDGLPLDQVPSVWSTKNGPQQVYELMIDFGMLPAPSFHGLDLMAYQATSAAMEIPLLPYQFLLGCPFECAFCSSDTDQKPRVRPVESVIRDLKKLRDDYGVRHFAFYNNMINGNRRYLKAFIAAMKQADLGIKWSDSARLSHLDLDDIRELAAIGCVELVWGLDAGSQEQSDFLNKKLDVAFSKKIIRLATEMGIKSQINFIVGMPHETEEQFRASLDYALEFLKDVRISVSDYRYNGGSPLFVTPRDFDLSKRGDTFYEIGGLSWLEHRRRVYSRYAEMVSKTCPQDISYIDSTFPEIALIKDDELFGAVSPRPAINDDGK